MKTKTKASIALLILLLPSCADFKGVNLEAITPWGNVSSHDGYVTISPRPIIIHEK